ncbi:hypothetical protein J437_LFUL003773, partial [Ladona fulva]
MEEGRNSSARAMNTQIGDERKTRWTFFRVGLFFGCFLILFIAAVLSTICHHGRDDWHVALRIYRGPFLLIEFIFLLGVNVHAWKSAGIDYVRTFELDPCNHVSEEDIFELAALFGVAWATSILGFLHASILHIPAYAFPLGLIVVVVLFVVNPFKVCKHEARFWFLRVLGRMLGTPFTPFNFADFWLADQVCSLWFAILDFYYLGCFYATNDNWDAAGDTSHCMEKAHVSRCIIAAIPAYLRFAQCCRRFYDTNEVFPHFLNALKYSTFFFVFGSLALHKVYEGQFSTHAESPYFYFWLLSSLVSTFSTFTWDVKLDWGLFEKNAGKNIFLRERLFYSSRSFNKQAPPEILFFIYHTSPRFMWNLFRLEFEHIIALEAASAPPDELNEEEVIQKMMDDDDGVMQCRKRNNILRREECFAGDFMSTIEK